MIPSFKGKTDPQILTSLLINYDFWNFSRKEQKPDKIDVLGILAKLRKD